MVTLKRPSSRDAVLGVGIAAGAVFEAVRVVRAPIHGTAGVVYAVLGLAGAAVLMVTQPKP